MSPGQLYRVAWIFYLLLALAGVAWIGWREGVIPLALFVAREGWWLDVVLGAASGALLYLVWDQARRRLASAHLLEQQLRQILGPLRPADVLGLAVLSGFAEELFFRGAVQGSWGWLWATLLFAVVHTGPGREFRLWTVFAAGAGLLFGGLMLWRGNLMGPVLGHALVNAANLWRWSTEDSPEP